MMLKAVKVRLRPADCAVLETQVRARTTGEAAFVIRGTSRPTALDVVTDIEGLAPTP